MAQETCQGEGTGVALWAELGHLGASGSARPLANRRKAPRTRRALGRGSGTVGFVFPVPGPELEVSLVRSVLQTVSLKPRNTR